MLSWKKRTKTEITRSEKRNKKPKENSQIKLPITSSKWQANMYANPLLLTDSITECKLEHDKKLLRHSLPPSMLSPRKKNMLSLQESNIPNNNIFNFHTNKGNTETSENESIIFIQNLNFPPPPPPPPPSLQFLSCQQQNNQHTFLSPQLSKSLNSNNVTNNKIIKEKSSNLLKEDVLLIKSPESSVLKREPIPLNSIISEKKELIQQKQKEIKKQKNEKRKLEKEEIIQLNSIQENKDHDNIECKGWCLKRKHKKGVSRWKKRYIILQGKFLYYFEEPQGKSIGKLALEFITLRILDENEKDPEHPHCFEIFITANAYHFTFKTKEESLTWFDVLNQKIQKIHLKKKKETLLSSKCNEHSHKPKSSSLAANIKEQKIKIKKEKDEIKQIQKQKRQKEEYASLAVNGFKDAIMRGWCHLKKRKHKKGFSRWKKRYLVLKEEALFYMKKPQTPDGLERLQVITTNVITLEGEEYKTKPFCFSLSTSTQATYIISVETKEDQQLWLETIINTCSRVHSLAKAARNI